MNIDFKNKYTFRNRWLCNLKNYSFKYLTNYSINCYLFSNMSMQITRKI